ncbi:TIGR02757 family protein [Helicobacter sp. 16-1353]|uniref:TIGR02757 family protein n=1 Tax=Helicobacter sp. 16-1353 TaxID=2004996 RepID=UPI000DCCE387|nr:TIGR02757 family protein [Helicobacter sp. 16-1353]RAX54681.1 TIGR02757 family protein [Helicobacter sp. 16-1353]
MQDLKSLLDKHYHLRNTTFELSLEKPDPLFAVKKNMHMKNIDEIAVICALLSYGNAKQILKILLSLDFSLLDNENAILNAEFPLYRFQNRDDIKAIFLCMNKIIQNGGIKRIFVESYSKENNVISGINAMIESLRSNVVLTKGLDFLIGRKSIKATSSSPLKRWNMFLRWFVRNDNIDIGLWSDKVSTKDLILPLDTHTFRLSKKLNLLTRKTYDLQSALDITDSLKRFSPNDPIKYDFALYRLGQEKIL